MNTGIVRTKELRKVYKLYAEEIAAVDEVDLEIKRGEFVAIIGPSGSGKTTLLDLIGCLDSISSGSLEVLGKDVASLKETELAGFRRGRISFIFQDFLLIPSLTVLENIEVGLLFARRDLDRTYLIKLLESVGLGKRIHHLPRELSGGEKQRVAIARALAIRPKLLIADEPTGNLDTKTSAEIFKLLERLSKEEKVTIVVATHDINLANLADRVISLVDGKITKNEKRN